VSVLTNSGGGNFALWSAPAVGPSPAGVVAFGNGAAPQLVSANADGNTLSVLRGNQLLGFAFNGNFTGNGAGLTALDATHIVNGGAGSGLDADTVDGLHASAFAPASGSTAYVAKTGDTMSGPLLLPADGLAAGGDQLVLTGGNVGIGTPSPGAKLEIAGYGNNLRFTRPGETTSFGAWEGLWGGKALLVVANWDTGNGLALDKDGNVGIGTLAPATALDIAGVVRSTSGGFQFPNGTVQTSAVPPTAAVPIGTVIDWWRPNPTFTVPDGYKICDGTAVADPQSPLYGYTVPNFTGQFVLGVTDPALIGSIGGTNSHSHGGYTSTDGSHTHSIPTVGDNVGAGSMYVIVDYGSTSSSGSHHHYVYTDTQLNYPPYVGLLKLMRIK
jgi:hypothetical protein